MKYVLFLLSLLMAASLQARTIDLNFVPPTEAEDGTPLTEAHELSHYELVFSNTEIPDEALLDIDINWTDELKQTGTVVDGYNVVWKDVAPVNISFLTELNTTYIRLRACNDGGCSAWSNSLLDFILPSPTGIEIN